MEPLFCIESKYTEDEFVKFNRFIIFHSKRTYVSLAAAIVVMAMGLIAFYSSGHLHIKPLVIGYVAGILLIAWAYTLGADRKARKYYASDKVINGLSYKLSFYDDHLDQLQDNGSASLQYSKIHKIYIAKDNIYIMRSPMVGFIIQRDQCPSELIDFIAKIKQDYNI